jgi:small subunit ribosomal protein S20
MANTRSAKKMVRKIEARTAVNKARRSRMRTAVRVLEEAIAAGDRDRAREALLASESALMHAATQGILPRNTASRKVSRLNARVKAMSA